MDYTAVTAHFPIAPVYQAQKPEYAFFDAQRSSGEGWRTPEGEDSNFGGWTVWLGRLQPVISSTRATISYALAFPAPWRVCTVCVVARPPELIRKHFRHIAPYTHERNFSYAGIKFRVNMALSKEAQTGFLESVCVILIVLRYNSAKLWKSRLPMFRQLDVDHHARRTLRGRCVVIACIKVMPLLCATHVVTGEPVANAG